MVWCCVSPHLQCIVECVVQSCGDHGAQHRSSISLCPDFQPYHSGAVGWCAILTELLWIKALKQMNEVGITEFRIGKHQDISAQRLESMDSWCCKRVPSESYDISHK